MSNGALKLLTGAGAGDDPVYAEDVFSTFLYTGNSSTQIINNGIDLSGEGGLLWVKNRTQAGYEHCLFDTERGATTRLKSNSSEMQTTGYLSSFNNNGFTLASGFYENQSSHPHVSWTFRKASGFFDVVTYSGTGSAQNISHNLKASPGFIMVKRYSGTEDWICYHNQLGHNKGIPLNQTNGSFTSSTYWNSTAPTSTQFTVGTHDRVNTSGHNYVAYLFAGYPGQTDYATFGEDSDETIINCGSYSGNGSTTSRDVTNVGFEPQWIFIKNTSSTNNWYIFDIMRGIVSEPGGDSYILANTHGAEVSTENYIDILPNGFSLRDDNAAVNANGSTYVYVAIRRPHKPASEFAATDLFKIAPRSNTTGADNAFVSNFPVDMGMARNVLSGTEMQIGARLTGDRYLETPTTDAEASVSAWGGWDSMNSVSLGFSKSAESPVEKYGWLFRRAPGFMDVVCYTGVSSSTVVTHNLGAVPEMVWRKKRSGSQQWYIWVSALSGSGNAQANGNFYTSSMGFSNDPYYAGDTQFNNITPPTATQFTQGALNSSGATYVAYLFATVPGISKVGSYTGTGNNINVDCGFSSGARFVIVKSASYGHFYLWDTARGLVAGSDPYLWLGSTSAHTTGDDYIDPLSTGFTITSSGPTELNSSGVKYAFLAIA